MWAQANKDWDVSIDKRHQEDLSDCKVLHKSYVRNFPKALKGEAIKSNDQQTSGHLAQSRPPTVLIDLILFVLCCTTHYSTLLYSSIQQYSTQGLLLCSTLPYSTRSLVLRLLSFFSTASPAHRIKTSELVLFYWSLLHFSPLHSTILYSPVLYSTLLYLLQPTLLYSI